MENQKTLLILDPSTSMRALIARIAEESHWQAVAVSDLPEAQAAMQGREFHAITTPSQLPSAGYRQVLENLRSQPRFEFTSVALITGDTAADCVDEALAAGITEVFSKTQLNHFQIYLQELAKPAAGQSLPEGLRALVLDDEASVGAYVAQTLTSMGLETTLTQRIDAALSASLEQRFDLVVVDLVLKDGESGNQFIRLLRASEGLSAKAHVIAVSGYSDPVRRQEALRCGAEAYLSKPFSADELGCQVVRMLLPQASDSGTAPFAERNNRFNLSQRERMICAMVMAGHPDKYIAKHLAISFWTVRAHIGRIFRKCGVGNRVELGNLLRFANPASANNAGTLPAASGAEAQSAVIDWLSLASHVVDGMQQGILVLDGNRNIVYANPPVQAITGFSSDELIGKPADELLAERTAARQIRKINEGIDAEGRWQGTLWTSRKNGEPFIAGATVRRMPPGMPIGAIYAVEFSDITSEHRTFQEVSHTALHDGLTGLPNRLLLKNRGEMEIHRARRSKRSFALLYLDLDGFKAINDRYGHASGDQALIEVARRLAELLRKSDTLARVGGDEFVALIADLDVPLQAEQVAKKLIEALHQPIAIEGKTHHLSASIGIAIAPLDSEKFDELIKCANQAMYCAKNQGGNTHWRYAPAARRACNHDQHR